jgi:hypothetical protein
MFHTDLDASIACDTDYNVQKCAALERGGTAGPAWAAMSHTYAPDYEKTPGRKMRVRTSETTFPIAWIVTDSIDTATSYLGSIHIDYELELSDPKPVSTGHAPYYTRVGPTTVTVITDGYTAANLWATATIGSISIPMNLSGANYFGRDMGDVNVGMGATMICTGDDGAGVQRWKFLGEDLEAAEVDMPNAFYVTAFDASTDAHV